MTEDWDIKSLLIADTTHEEREQIVAESIRDIDGACVGRTPGFIEMYQGGDRASLCD